MTRARPGAGRKDALDAPSLERCLSSWPEAPRLCARLTELDLLARAARAAFEHWGVGVVLLGRGGALVSLNAVAARLLGLDAADIEPLSTRLRDEAVPLDFDTIVPGVPTCVERRPGHWIRVTVLAMPSSPATDEPGRPAAAAFITDANDDLQRELTAVRARYGLTPAELRVAVHIARGQGMAEAARALRISQNTVKTQLRTVFSKTGTRRQSQLAALFAGCERLRPVQLVARSRSGGAPRAS